MMARSQNNDSPDYVESPDPHTVQTDFQCQTARTSDAALYSNLYAGQSWPGLPYDWFVVTFHVRRNVLIYSLRLTTPAFILSNFVTDTSSTKQGHRQNVLCPNLDDGGFGHICYKEPCTTRHFCGDCQWCTLCFCFCRRSQCIAQGLWTQRQRSTACTIRQSERHCGLAAARRCADLGVSLDAVCVLVVCHH